MVRPPLPHLRQDFRELYLALTGKPLTRCPKCHIGTLEIVEILLPGWKLPLEGLLVKHSSNLHLERCPAVTSAGGVSYRRPGHAIRAFRPGAGPRFAVLPPVGTGAAVPVCALSVWPQSAASAFNPVTGQHTAVSFTQRFHHSRRGDRGPCNRHFVRRERRNLMPCQQASTIQCFAPSRSCSRVRTAPFTKAGEGGGRSFLHLSEPRERTVRELLERRGEHSGIAPLCTNLPIEGGAFLPKVEYFLSIRPDGRQTGCANDPTKI